MAEAATTPAVPVTGPPMGGTTHGLYSSPDGRALLAADVETVPSDRRERWIAAGEGRAFERRKSELNLGFSTRKVGAAVLANTLLGGSGMLGIPHAFALSGYALGLVCITFFGLASCFGSHLLHCAARKEGGAPCSFYSVAEAAAPRWTWLIDSAVMVKCFGVGTSYLIIVGDLAPDAARHFGLNGASRWLAITVGFCIAGPLACFRHLSALKYTAIAALLIVVWTSILVVMFFFRIGGDFHPCPEAGDQLPCGGAEFKAVAAGDDVHAFIKGLPVIIFGFTCQQNVFTICNEVRNATRRRMDQILYGSYAMAGLLFSAVALFGYATYGSNVKGDVLMGYPQGGVVQVTRLFFSCVAIFSYPLQAHPSRNSALGLMRMALGSEHEGLHYVVITALYLSGSYLLAISVESLGTMLAIVGATGSTLVSYILPGLLYMRTHENWGFKRYLAIVQLSLGCIIMPVCLTVIFI